MYGFAGLPDGNDKGLSGKNFRKDAVILVILYSSPAEMSVTVPLFQMVA